MQPFALYEDWEHCSVFKVCWDYAIKVLCAPHSNPPTEEGTYWSKKKYNELLHKVRLPSGNTVNLSWISTIYQTLICRSRVGLIWWKPNQFGRQKACCIGRFILGKPRHPIGCTWINMGLSKHNLVADKKYHLLLPCQQLEAQQKHFRVFFSYGKYELSLKSLGKFSGKKPMFIVLFIMKLSVVIKLIMQW